ncbi:MAG TPA: DUF503 domain-containing protein [Actinomycetota bacterium]|nr:DUF503 domain-containing protein [Actinomycetota bacterium]
MFIGVARLELFIPDSASLKDKRHVLRSITDGVRRKFNVSIAEVEYQDLWQRAALGIACTSESIGQCRKILQEVEKTVGRAALEGAEIVARETEIVAWEDL